MNPFEVAFGVAVRTLAKNLISLAKGNRYALKDLPLLEMTTESMGTWLDEQKELATALRKNKKSLVTECERGVELCHDLDVDGSVLGKILTPSGVGLMITNSSYRRVRADKISDLQMILGILD